MLPEEELHDLANDIKTHGQREAIVMLDGMVLDGRNRWMACVYAGVTPRTTDYKGTQQEALSFVWSTNVHRRHLSSGQTAIALAKREKLDGEFAATVEAMRKAAPKNNNTKKNDKSVVQKIEPVKDNSTLIDHKLAASVGTNRSYVATARKVVEQAPELAEKIERGEMTLSQASTEMKREIKRKDLQQKEVVAASNGADWQLINKDVLDGLSDIEAKARLIFTDPPYNIGIEYGDHHNDSMEDSKFISWCLSWMKACCDKLTDDGSMWVMINDEFAADFVINLRECGLHMRGWIKWYETFGVNCSHNFNRTSRHILYFVKNQKKFVFNETEVLRQSDRQLKYNDSRAQSSGKIEDDVWQIPRLSGTCTERIPDFPTQLPFELVSRIVRVASEPGDLVIDPFNGSGTTGVAAIKSQRKYVGIDASKKFIELSSMRLKGAE
jgi:site-specific DNA-methyltransferase (adenine-specific)